MAEGDTNKEVDGETSTKKAVSNQSKGKKAEESQSVPSIHMTEDQFTELLKRLPTMSAKSFVKCTIQFQGEHDRSKVEEFINGVKLYKEMEKISDDDALTGLPLLLKGKASDWWLGVRAEIKTWAAALKAISAAFSPQKQPHDIYMDIFATPQGKDEGIDDFLCRKRLLLGALPPKRHKEEEQIDLIYGLLKLELRKRIARSDIKTFAELTEKARHQEALRKFKPTSTSTDKVDKPGTSAASQPTRTFIKTNLTRCLFCAKKGHTLEVCRKRLAKLKSNGTEESDVAKPAVTCYGCGAPGVFRSKCSTCNSKETPPKEVAFYTIEITREDQVKLPTIEVKVLGEMGYAYMDTAARTSVAGEHLYKLMRDKGVQFCSQVAIIRLADGTVKMRQILTVTTEILLGNRVKPITFTIMPDAIENRTLLGIDFLETAGIVLSPPQRAWNFIDKPAEAFPFLQLMNHIQIPLSKDAKQLTFTEPANEKEPLPVLLKAAKQLTFTEPANVNEPLPDFLSWARELKLLSPLPATPSPQRDTEADVSPPKLPRWQLIKMPTPPRPVRPREPADNESQVDPHQVHLPSICKISVKYLRN
ncbi:uncharacterized protein LOC134794569 [Cydia splendana]|uniref:uncharacterized protein LOC134794569 n=1 Tax=Cydia splendana TaxID=1100963 RepID=UPI00300C1E81